MSFQLGAKGLSLNLQVAANVPTQVLTDIKRFKQILFNLMGNAAKFTFQGGLTVRVGFQDHHLLVSEVEDTGIGIKYEDLNRLFRFFGCLAKSRDINRGGMGLGLTISKMILQQLKGDITVES